MESTNITFQNDILTVENLSKAYNNTVVLDIPNLVIKRGESFGLVGNNGAGKTTLFRLVLDLIVSSSGGVLSNGVNVKGSELWKAYTGSYLDEGFLIDFLTPEEYFKFVASLNKMSDGDLNLFYERFKDFFNDEILGKKKYIRDLSKGNQKKVGIAAAMMTHPAVLILDEPFTNLDPSSQIRLKQMLKQEQEEKEVTMLISSHDLNHVTDVSKRIVVLERGVIVHDINTTDQTLRDLEDYFAAQINH